MRIVIKRIYMLMIAVLNLLFKPKRLNRNHIVVMMTFSQDVMPIIEVLCKQGYDVTVIGKQGVQHQLRNFKNITFIPAGNKKIVSHMKALSSAKVIILDTYYLMMGGYNKKKGQTVIQTWHAAGALKNFGLTDHQVNLNNQTMVDQYKRVYRATDYYLVGGEEMVQCFEESFEAQPRQMLKFGLPRLVEYLNMDIEKAQRILKAHYHIKDKLAIYVPTYRESKIENRKIDKEKFEQKLPNYTLLSHLHPSIRDRYSTQNIDISSLIIMADVIISDYSSLPIEASLLNKPTLFYIYDEAEYEDVRGLNSFYYDIPNKYKFDDEDSLIQAIKENDSSLDSLFNSWHQYNTKESLNKLVNFINKMVKS